MVPFGPGLRMMRVPQKNETVIDMGDMGLVHIQSQLQFIFQKGAAFLPDGPGVGLVAFDDEHEVIGIAAISHRRFPLPVLPDSDGSPSGDAEVPSPAVLAGLFAQVFVLQPLIKLIEHDVGQ